jgi:hypothetical protein
MYDKRTAGSDKYLTGLNSVCQKFSVCGLRMLVGHYTNLSFLQTKSNIFIKSHPWRNRLIFVSP